MNISIPDQMHKAVLKIIRFNSHVRSIFFLVSRMHPECLITVLLLCVVGTVYPFHGGNQVLAGLMDVNAWFPDGRTDFSVG